LGFTSFGDFGGFGVFGIVNEEISLGLASSDISFSIKVIVHISVDIEMVGFNLADDGDMGRFLEVPELEAGHFVDNDGAWV